MAKRLGIYKLVLISAFMITEPAFAEAPALQGLRVRACSATQVQVEIGGDLYTIDRSRPNRPDVRVRTKDNVFLRLNPNQASTYDRQFASCKTMADASRMTMEFQETLQPRKKAQESSGVSAVHGFRIRSCSPMQVQFEMGGELYTLNRSQPARPMILKQDKDKVLVRLAPHQVNTYSRQFASCKTMQDADRMTKEFRATFQQSGSNAASTGHRQPQRTQRAR